MNKNNINKLKESLVKTIHSFNSNKTLLYKNKFNISTIHRSLVILLII